MSDIETNAFKEAANGKLHRSGHSNKAIGGDIDVSGSTSYKRTSKQIWLSDVETTTTDNNSTQKGFPSYNAEAFRVGLHNYYYSKTQFKGKKYIHLIPFFGFLCATFKDTLSRAFHKLCRLKLADFLSPSPLLSSFVLNRAYLVNRVWGQPSPSPTKFYYGSRLDVQFPIVRFA